MTLKEIFNALHEIDPDLAHALLHEAIHRYGRSDSRVKEMFNETV